MRQTLRGFAAEGRTVFVSSHLMGELEGAADQLVVIGRGRLLADVSVDELVSSASDGRVEVVTPDATGAMTVLAGAGATVISSGSNRLTVDGVPARRVSELLAAHRVPLEGLTQRRATLEEAYFRLTRDAGEHSSVSITPGRAPA
jgi:ABC-2 type transport system ATP-binding protein